MIKLRILDLCSGIGGFSRGLERTGAFETVAFCESAAFPRAVLAKHWPRVPILGDIKTADFPAADTITAGWPCQDISLIGPGSGLAGPRSGLWYAVVRAVRLVRPGWVLLENVAELLDRGMGEVVGSLATSGYDAEWDSVLACATDANHIRDPVWIVANDRRFGLPFGQRLFTRGQVADAAAKASGRWDDLSVVGRAVHGLTRPDTQSSGHREFAHPGHPRNDWPRPHCVGGGMMRFTFTFKHPDGVLALTGECPDDGLMEAFDDMMDAAEKQAASPPALIRTRVSVIRRGTGA